VAGNKSLSSRLNLKIKHFNYHVVTFYSILGMAKTEKLDILNIA
jgi:hypothetical protein